MKSSLGNRSVAARQELIQNGNGRRAWPFTSAPLGNQSAGEASRKFRFTGMKRARIVILAVALTAGSGAAYLSQSKPQPVAAPQVAAEPVRVPATEVLVAASDLELGTKLGPGSLKWLPWPANGLNNGMIRKDDNREAIAQLTDSIVREGFVANEPIRKEKLIKTDTGLLAAMLPEGKRALAIVIDHSGSNSAGTLVLPNDHVDVLHVYKDWQASKSQEIEVYTSEILLRNIKVLAIGQNIQGKDGQRAAVGETATLELDPEQANMIALAQRSGWLTLALRSVADDHAPPQLGKPETATVTIMRGAKREEYAVLQSRDLGDVPGAPVTPTVRPVAFPALARR